MEIIPKLLFLLPSIFCCIFYGADGKVYEPCELAQEMITFHRFPKADIADCKDFSIPFAWLIVIG